MTNNTGQIDIVDGGDDYLTMQQCPMSISPCGRYFALASLAGQLNVWDTITSDIVAQYIPSKHLSANCTKISWPPDYYPMINNQINGTPTKNDNVAVNELKKLSLLAMGTENGTIFLFSVHKNEIHSILSNDDHKKSIDVGHTERINDLCWPSSSSSSSTLMDSLFSCSQDKFIIEWSIIESKIKCKTMLDPNSMTTSICVLDNENIITGSNQLKWWNWPKKQLLKTFSGHSNEIRFLRPILFPTINSSSSSSSSTIDVYLLSSAVSDRYINLWKLDQPEPVSSQKNKASNSLASFLLDDEPISLEIAKTVVDNSLYILSVSKSGHFHMFEETIRLASNTKGPIAPKYRLNIQTRFDSKKNNSPTKNQNKRSRIERQIPYMYAYLDSNQLKGKSSKITNGNTNDNHQSPQLKDNSRIHIQTIYGTTNRPIFECISIYECEKLCQEQQQQQKSSSLPLASNNNQATIIKDPSILKSIDLLPRPLLENVSIIKSENNIKIKSAKHSEHGTTVIGPAGMVAHQPLFNGVITENGDDSQNNNDDEMMLSEDEQKHSSTDNKQDINNNNKLKKSNSNSDVGCNKKSELTLDEQLKLMETNNDDDNERQHYIPKRKKRNRRSKSNKQQQQQQIGTESLVNVLVQGLQSNDGKMLSTVLQTDHTDIIIMNTVKKLPIQHVPKLLNQLQKGLISGQQSQRESGSNSGVGQQYSIYLKWITFLLRNRFSYLMTMPNSAEKFLPLKQLIQAKTASLEKCYQLKGRLDLILSQAKLDDTQGYEKIIIYKTEIDI
nr:probable serine/threonine-protein kinase cdc7 [Dermatophagoides farinae]